MKGLVLAPDQLTAVYRSGMLDLMRGHFEGVGEEQFERDLGEKDRVLLLEDEGGRLLGFSTLACYPAEFDGELLQVVVSGDTIVDRAGWGSPGLARIWIRTVHELQAAGETGRRWMWLLLTSGFRTYRFLPVFWRSFWPCRRGETPRRTLAMIDALAGERFGCCYDPVSGIVRFEQPQRLRADLRRIDEARLRDPDVTFFLERNPGHAQGDELVCLCELCDENLTAAGRRMVGRSRDQNATSRPVA